MPSFSIEAPGEANPLTESQLVQTLRCAVSSDPNQIQTGTAQLQQWEKAPRYYVHLQSAYIDHRLPVELRYLAIIQLKNGIDKYWRKTATNAVPKDDKTLIRSRLIQSCFNEPQERLALQCALVIAKVARFEYPHDWPGAIEDLVQTLRSQAPPLHIARALLVLLHIVKELSTARLQRNRQNLQAAAPEIVHVLATQYTNSVAYWFPRHEQGEVSEDLLDAMMLSLMTMKVLRRLLIAGYEHPNRHDEVVAIWSTTQQHLQGFLQHPRIEKLPLQLAKLHYEMAKQHPAAFALLPDSIELTMAYWGLAKSYGHSMGAHGTVQAALENAKIGTDGDAADDKSTTEKVALRGLLILRACVKMVHNPAQTFKYRHPIDKEEKSAATGLIRQNLLTAALVQDVMETLITHFFVFRASDLREWEEEPEEWEKREYGDGEGTDDWDFSLRSCSEVLFLDLAINYKEILVQPLLQVFYSVASTGNEDVLFKDSVYTAVGLAAPVLFEHLDFDAFIRDVLVQEVQKQVPGFHILRRRIAILLAQWISIKVTECKLVYQIFQHLLNPEDALNDQVVRVTAGRQLCKVVDSFDTKPEDLEPFLDVILSRLLALIAEVELTETKMALLNTVSVIVERMEHLITPFAERIVAVLPGLWDASGEEHLMKQAILVVLTRLVVAMKVNSAPLHRMSLGIVYGAVKPGSDTAVYLAEDALDLWGSIIVQMKEVSAPATSLVSLLFTLYESEHLRKALEITESYLLLAPEYMLSVYQRPQFFGHLSKVFSEVRNKPEGNGTICNLVELAVRQVHKLAGGDAVEQTCADLVGAGFVGYLIDGLYGSWKAHCTTGPNRPAAPVDGIVETDYFAVLARIILGSLSGFSRAIQAAELEQGSRPQQSFDEILQWLLEEWFSHMENVGDPSRKKLMALALAALLNTKEPFMLINLQSLMTLWTEVITELREDAEDGQGDSLVYSQPARLQNPDPNEAPEDMRRREVTYGDEVHSVSLPAFVKGSLERAVEAAGGSEAFQREWVTNVDQDVLKQFTGLGIM
ncbi:hypothetical protein LTR97_002231 [Elasticomyces elasticus]|uniref:Importin N-terminal domain-containing protein n=1 Tax=Elasticomyces elasticus TaxID=574655 RepID=A0AAN7ZVI9_9PEZI|nr:hypothetical protein LTR97_002231 [Elasticomyces elasticus]